MASYSINRRAVTKARRLLDASHYVLDSNWDETQPRAADENAFLKSHSWDEYGEWHLGVTDGAADQTKARFVCLRRLSARPSSGHHRVSFRAAEWRHKEIELAAHALLQYVDMKSGWHMVCA